MARYLVIAFALVCVLLVAEARFVKKSAFEERVSAVHKARTSSKKSLSTEGAKFSLRNGGMSDASQMTSGDKKLGDILGNSKKNGLRSPFSRAGTSNKKSYQEVFFAAEYIEGVVGGFAMAPCSVGMMAFADMLGDVDWDTIDWEHVSELEVQTHVLAFIEWWTENKCGEFFQSVYSFSHYVWSIFWDDLYESNPEWPSCVDNMPKQPDGTLDWTVAFQHRSFMNPGEWDNVPEPQTECEAFELVAEIYLDFFFPIMFDSMPEAVLEDMFNDFGVNDYIDPHFGYGYFENQSGQGGGNGNGNGGGQGNNGVKKALLALLKGD